MHRHQRRRTRRIHRHRRTPQAQQIRNPPHRGAVRVPGAQVGIDLGAALQVDDGVVPRRQPHHDAGSAAAQRIRRDAGVLERLPGHLQKHPLLRVHRRGLPWRDAEEVGIKPGHIGDEPTPLGHHAARRRRVGIIECVGIPTIRRHLADRILTVDQQPPKTLRPNHITGKRHPIPTTATGSVSRFSATSRRALSSSILCSASVMIARRSGVALVIWLTQAFPKLLEQFGLREVFVGVDNLLLGQ